MPPTKSKKFSIFVAILILFIGIFVGGFLFIKNKAGSANISDQVNYLFGKENSVATQDKNADSDNDGLPDWQEKVYRTDPRKPDTDGDGYMDGEEAASGYDPTKKAPNDALTGTDTNIARPLPKNLTKALSQRLGQAIVSGKIPSFDKTTGKPLTTAQLENDEGLKQAINDAFDQEITEFSLPDIPDSELNISDKVGKDETMAYLAQLDQSLNKIPPAPDSEMQLFYEAMKSRDFSKVQEISNLYQDTYDKLKQMTVPANFVSIHKGFMGVIWVTNNIYKAVINIDQDPLKTTIAFMNYRKIIEATKSFGLEMVKERRKFF
jgi:hypothetical protein